MRKLSASGAVICYLSLMRKLSAGGAVICYRSLMQKLSAGGAVITNPPMNQNKTEGDMVNFHCQGEGTPGKGSTIKILIIYFMCHACHVPF